MMAADVNDSGGAGGKFGAGGGDAAHLLDPCSSCAPHSLTLTIALCTGAGNRTQYCQVLPKGDRVRHHQPRQLDCPHRR
jgi:hypothetical protein